MLRHFVKQRFARVDTSSLELLCPGARVGHAAAASTAVASLLPTCADSRSPASTSRSLAYRGLCASGSLSAGQHHSAPRRVAACMSGALEGNLDSEPSWEMLLELIATARSWRHPPWYISLCGDCTKLNLCGNQLLFEGIMVRMTRQVERRRARHSRPASGSHSSTSSQTSRSHGARKSLPQGGGRFQRRTREQDAGGRRAGAVGRKTHPPRQRHRRPAHHHTGTCTIETADKASSLQRKQEQA